MSSKAAGYVSSSVTQRDSDEVVISKFVAMHGDVYDYSDMVYINSKTKIDIICKSHGVFSQTPGDHRRGSRCPECGLAAMRNTKTKTTEKAVEDFEAKHGLVYDYSNVRYISAWGKVSIICHTHGEFLQAPEHHLRGSGCPKCAMYGFNPLKPAILYYVKVSTDCGYLYKVGITNRSVEERFGADIGAITTIKTWDYEVGADAYQAEQNILDLNSEWAYTGPSVLRSGNTELFTVDIGDFNE